jgi:hypothetical protein
MDEAIAYVYAGATTGVGATPWTLKNPGTTSNNEFGTSVATAGDVDGDGYADVLIGAPNGPAAGSYVFLGGAAGPITGGVALAKPTWSMEFGYVVAGVGDTNGDLLADIGVGDPLAWPSDRTLKQRGVVYLYSGANPFSGASMPVELVAAMPNVGSGFGGTVARLTPRSSRGAGRLSVLSPSRR